MDYIDREMFLAAIEKMKNPPPREKQPACQICGDPMIRSPIYFGFYCLICEPGAFKGLL